MGRQSPYPFQAGQGELLASSRQQDAIAADNILIGYH